MRPSDCEKMFFKNTSEVIKNNDFENILWGGYYGYHADLFTDILKESNQFNMEIKMENILS